MLSSQLWPVEACTPHDLWPCLFSTSHRCPIGSRWTLHHFHQTVPEQICCAVHYPAGKRSCCFHGDMYNNVALDAISMFFSSAVRGFNVMADLCIWYPPRDNIFPYFALIIYIYIYFRNPKTHLITFQITDTQKFSPLTLPSRSSTSVQPECAWRYLAWNSKPSKVFQGMSSFITKG